MYTMNENPVADDLWIPPTDLGIDKNATICSLLSNTCVVEKFWNNVLQNLS
jgi:hypothetical protein